MTDAERCYAAALRIISYRFNSENELRRKLQAKKFEKPLIDATLERLRREKLVDDERLVRSACESRVRTLVRRKGEEYLTTYEGRTKLIAWLLNRGFDGDLVRSVVKEIAGR